MFRQSVVICWLVLIGMEIPYVVTPKVDTTSVSTIAIVGDSISAGVGRDETAVTWPKILSRTMGWSVVDQSQMGATVKSALEQAKGIPDDCPIVVLEIGGNDVLGSTNVDDFSVGLDRLFSTICRADRIVLMFELPLPPGYGGFGRVQRRLSRRYNVRLIPKRILMGIIARPDATIDSVHLSQSGHESMANTLSTILVTK